MFKKKMVILGVAAMVVSSMVMGCGNKETKSHTKQDSKIEGNAPLKLWVGLNQGEFYRDLVQDFEKDNNVTVEVVEVENPNEDLLKDSDAAADVLKVPHDQLGKLVDAGTVYENEKYGQNVQDDSIDLALKGASYDGKIYGYPASAESMFLYYDKSVYSEEDVKTMDSLTSKGKVGINIAEEGADYRLSPWFLANGSYLFGENGEDVEGSTLNNEQGVNVLKWVGNARNNENIVAVNADEISALQEGKINALFSGVWNTKNVKEVLGENMGTAVYPSMDFGDGEVNLKAFTGVTIFVVNTASKNPAQAMDLAEFITNEESQIKAFEAINTIPSNAKARESKEVLDSQVAQTVIESTTLEHSVLMPKIPEMKNFWPNMNAILIDAYNGKIPEDQMQGKLDTLVKDISKKAE